MKKRISVLFAALILLLSLAVPVCAQELPDPQRTGSLTFWMSFNGQPLEGGSLTLYRVGVISVTDGDAGFLPVPELADGPQWTDLSDPKLAKELAELSQSRDLPEIREEILGGWVTFAPMEPGLYLVTQKTSEAAAGFDAIQPFLISLPRWEDDGYVYDVTASPKVPLVPEETPPPPPSEPPPPPPPDIPQTGQLNWPVPVLAVTGMARFLFGWTLFYGTGRKRR